MGNKVKLWDDAWNIAQAWQHDINQREHEREGSRYHMAKIVGAEATVGMIDVTGVNARDIIRYAYELSQPRGLGHMAFIPGEMPEETLEAIYRTLNRDAGDGESPGVALSMGIVLGRNVCMAIYKWRDMYFIKPFWEMHTDQELEELVTLCELDSDRIITAREEARKHFG